MSIDEREEARLQFISTTHRTAFDQRRHYEWQTVITTLTFYALTVAAVYAGDFRLPKSQCAVGMIFSLALLGLATISCRFLQHIHEANATNKGITEAAERAIIETSVIKEVRGALPPVRRGSEGNWALRWECTIICLFALISALLLWLAPDLPCH